MDCVVFVLNGSIRDDGPLPEVYEHTRAGFHAQCDAESWNKLKKYATAAGPDRDRHFRHFHERRRNRVPRD